MGNTKFGNLFAAALIAGAFILILYHLPQAIIRTACIAAVGDQHCASPETIKATRDSIDKLDRVSNQ